MKALLAIIALISIVNSASGGNWRAAKWWRSLPAEARVYYMNGVFDGISTGPSFIAQDASSEKIAEKASKALPKIFAGMDAAGAIRALDWFYQTPQNRNIPIGPAVLYLAIAGHPELQSDAQKLLAELRGKSR